MPYTSAEVVALPNVSALCHQRTSRHDAFASGADPIEGRESFARLLDRIEGNGVSSSMIARSRSPSPA
jgi:hypothetical protein